MQRAPLATVNPEPLSAPARLGLLPALATSPPRPHLPLTPTMIMPHHRLHDVLHVVKDELVARQAFRSLANLVKCNREFRTVFSPSLQGWRIVLGGTGARQAFADIIGSVAVANAEEKTRSLSSRTPLNRTVRSRRSRFGRYTAQKRWDEPSRPPAREAWEDNHHRQANRLHHRRIRLLERCELLVIQDMLGAEALVEASIAAGDDERAFKQVKSLCLGPSLLLRLAERTDHTQDVLHHLQERLEPRHVCFSLAIGHEAKTMRRLERIGRMPDTDADKGWTKHYLEGTSRISKALCESWAPETITIHGMTAENIPAVYSRQTTIFFGPAPPSEEAGCDSIYWRADVRADEIANGVGVIGDDESAVFVGLEEFAGREAIREGELGELTVADRVWQQFPQEFMRVFAQSRTKFQARDEAQRCVCCGQM